MYDQSERPRVRRKIRWGRLFAVLFVFLILAGSIAGYAAYEYMMLTEPVTNNKANGSEALTNRINILLLGVDDGEFGNSDAPKRSDTMILASINPETGKINMLSVPRDTLVQIPGRDGEDKIAHAFAYGGPELSKRTVEDFLHVPIDYYVVANWQGFMKIVDILGGVDLYVEHNMDYEDPYANLSIHLTKGFQHLDGEKAGEYVRFRHDELGDIGRVQRQQRFMKALNDEIFKVGTIFKLPALTSTLKENISTDMSTITVLRLLNTVKNFKSDTDLRTEMLPGSFATINGVSYWQPDEEQINVLLQDMFGKPNNK